MIISGLYIGTDADTPLRRLDLRVDVDQVAPDALVLDRISGDLFTLIGPADTDGVHECSWRVEVPDTQSRGVPFTFPARQVTVLPPTTVGGNLFLAVTIDHGPAGLRAIVEMTLPNEPRKRTFTCDRRGPWFREVRLDFDVCVTASGPGAPVVFPEPAHTPGDQDLVHPPGFTRRVTLKDALLEAGVRVDRSHQPAAIDDSSKDGVWDDAELDVALRDQLEVRGLLHESKWPRWFLWGFLATRHRSDGTRGVMFDSDWPPRQGCALFVKQGDFLALSQEPSADLNQALARRFYLFTWMHEIGHSLGLRETADLGVSHQDELSWMNFHRARTGAGGFWSRFRFAFHEREVFHIRHDHWRSVVMGGSQLVGETRAHSTSASRLFSPIVPLTEDGSNPVLEVLLRSRGYFDFMAPVRVEARLRNLSPCEQPIEEDLQPEGGRVLVAIQRPDGRVKEYLPVMRTMGDVRTRPLAGMRAHEHGPDRYSEELDITYGQGGFYFDAPGEYRIRLLYLDSRRGVIPSNVLRVRIGYPWSRTYDRLAQDFFSDDVGRCLYLRGSHAPYLETNGLNVLRDMTARCVGTLMGCDLADAIVPGVARPFWQTTQGKVKRHKHPDPAGAIDLTRPALRFLERADARELNLSDARLVQTRARQLRIMEQNRLATEELVNLHRRLQRRGVHSSVLQEIRDSARTIVGATIDSEW
jgi:hypothetical protein